MGGSGKDSGSSDIEIMAASGPGQKRIGAKTVDAPGAPAGTPGRASGGQPAGRGRKARRNASAAGAGSEGKTPTGAARNDGVEPGTAREGDLEALQRKRRRLQPNATDNTGTNGTAPAGPASDAAARTARSPSAGDHEPDATVPGSRARLASLQPAAPKPGRGAAPAAKPRDPPVTPSDGGAPHGSAAPARGRAGDPVGAAAGTSAAPTGSAGRAGRSTTPPAAAQDASPPPQQRAPSPPDDASPPNADARRALKAVMDSLQSCGNEERTPPPGALTVPLLRHQRLGLSWMARREDGGVPQGGILADDQGLGKTISVLALIATNRPPEGSLGQVVPPAAPSNGKPAMPRVASEASAGSAGPGSGSTGAGSDGAGGAARSGAPRPGLRRGGTLVVCPTTVLQQWGREFQDRVGASCGMGLYVYHGSSRVRDPSILSRYHVVLTTYAILGQEMPHGELARPEGAPCEGGEVAGPGRPMLGPPGTSRKKLLRGGPLFGILWGRVVLDEAQMIKNHRTITCAAACALHAESRWCLSGTPIQNSLDDLLAFFMFLRYQPYSDPSTFRVMVKDPAAQDPATAFRRVQAILQGVLLRRTKGTKIDGIPIISLPERRQVRKVCSFNAEERAFYDRLRRESLQQIRQIREGGAGAPGSQYANMLLLLLRLRQACNHRKLLTMRAARSADHSKHISAEVKAAKKLPAELRTDLLQILSGDPPATCATCGDIPEDPMASRCRHVFCAQCAAPALGGGPGADSGGFQCPFCGLELSSIDLFTPDALAAADPSKAAEGKALARESAAGRACAVGEVPSSSKLDELMRQLDEMAGKSKSKKEPGAGAAGAAGGYSRVKSDRKLLGSFRKLPPVPVAPAAAAGSGTASTAAAMPDKAIVFSQWTSMLDLVQARLDAKKYGYRRLDGTMSIAHRERAIEDFQQRPEVTVMIMSLKAAALGLNLVCANHIILLDPWFNPTVEEQAIDRAHRIGQTRAVTVTRITISGSVEDRITQLQERKQEMVRAALGEGPAGTEAGGPTNRLSLGDLEFLFGLKNENEGA
ncbi:unnamed protein product [Pedinophyceae sp. YPF-701]|nr:unnamed protein product [Pedinophyceae sp. YPF-701]